ncbi:uncharacterized protein VICG_01650 [Vittaforma corneae ATCC 50505]|uniref:Uncharacterized protein n=1 Tax=Vittaforma corneae (strain ATCC 50505) TaxID=993615 RepID=L2GLV8_VITCO|nr:uncharacterized protein VICG_01650 [Vittaforma corneae ATCC 50505]ELA41277.1 hypothetical protein VICG_01650 [Vittaforma corneae ATCC 50505]
MEVANSIIKAIESKDENEFELMRSRMKAKKVLSRAEFRKLIELLKKQSVEILSIQDLTVGECRLLGKALMATKLQDIDEVISCVISKQAGRAALLLNCLLNKKCKINLVPLQEYLKDMIANEIQLCHLKLLLTISRNYPSLIDNSVIEFCSRKSHPVCKMILEKHQIEYE